MADELRIDHRPELERPILVAAFRGWNDGAQAASLAAGYLAKTWGAERFADVDPEDILATGVSGDQLKATLAAVPGRVIFFLDACHAGGFSKNKKRAAGALTDDLIRDLAADDRADRKLPSDELVEDRPADRTNSRNDVHSGFWHLGRPLWTSTI